MEKYSNLNTKFHSQVFRRRCRRRVYKFPRILKIFAFVFFALINTQKFSFNFFFIFSLPSDFFSIYPWVFFLGGAVFEKYHNIWGKREEREWGFHFFSLKGVMMKKEMRGGGYTYEWRKLSFMCCVEKFFRAAKWRKF